MRKTAKKIRCLFFLIAALFAALPASAQLAPPNDAGVTMGHVHLFVKDVEAQKNFWTADDGRHSRAKRALMLIQFPGTYIMLRQADPVGSPGGVDRRSLRLCVEGYAQALAKWKADGVEIEQTGNPNQGYVHGPDGIRVEFFRRPFPSDCGRDESHSFLSGGYSRDASVVRENVWRRAGKRPRQSSPGLDRLRRYPGHESYPSRRGRRAWFPRRGVRSIISAST